MGPAGVQRGAQGRSVRVLCSVSILPLSIGAGLAKPMHHAVLLHMRSHISNVGLECAASTRADAIVLQCNVVRAVMSSDQEP